MRFNLLFTEAVQGAAVEEKSMKGYWLILGTEITDQAAQDEYNRLWAPIAEKYQHA